MIRAQRLRALVLVAFVIGVTAALVPASPAFSSDDPRFTEQWALDQIGAPAAWSVSKGAGIRIGVVDSGIDASHPDLAAKIDAQADCLGGSCVEGDAPDGDGHGTIVAGIAAAATDNRAGVAGAAPEARLLVAKALDDDGSGNTEDINNAIRWVVDRGARVVNLSLGDPNQVYVRLAGTSLASGIEYAWTRGAVPVLAAGNYRDGLSEEGAAYGNLDAVVVGATERGGPVASYSSPLGNAKWGVVAPGGAGRARRDGILAPVPGGGYAEVSGTSMAAPHVSATLALLLAQGRSPSAAVEALLAGLDRSSCGAGCQGRLRADSAVAVPIPGVGTVPTTTALPIAPAEGDDESGAGAVAIVLAVAAVVVAGGAIGAIFVVRRQRL